MSFVKYGIGSVEDNTRILYDNLVGFLGSLQWNTANVL